MTARLQGKELLSELLAVARQQESALEQEDFASFALLCDRRDGLMDALSAADWTDLRGTQEMVWELVARDRRNTARLKQRLADVARKMAELRRGAGALYSYRTSLQTSTADDRLLDRSA